MKKNEALTLALLYSRWIDECRMVKSSNTVKTYSEMMHLFMSFLEEQGATSKSFCISSDLSRDRIVTWIKWMNEKRGSKPQSCNARLAALRSFLKYIGEKDIVYRHLYLAAKTVGRMKVHKIKVEGLSEKAVEAILREPDMNSMTGYRDAMFISLLYTTAARINEILSIKITDLQLDMDTPYVMLTGKGEKNRPAYLPTKLVKNIRKYIKKFHGNQPNADDYLFFSRVKGKNTKLTPEAMDKRLKLYAKVANSKCPDVPIGLHAHQFRHARASHLLENKVVNIAQLSKIMGHEQLATTMIYLDVTTDMKTRAMMEMEDLKMRSIPRKWSDNESSLTDLFKIE